MKPAALTALWLAAATPTALLAQGSPGPFGLPLDATGRTALDTGIEMLAATLANGLQASRDAARASGTLPMPPHIRAALLTWYPAEVLEGVEYRIGAPTDATVQSLSIRYGHATAVTTIDTITFVEAFDATNNVALWAHEVKHVEQFRRWGLLDFARRYLRDHRAVEDEAYATAAAFRAAYDAGAWRHAPAVPLPFAAPEEPARICTTPEGACVMAVPIAPGQGCSCPSDRGRVQGLTH